MYIKLLGAILVLVGCGGYGVMMAVNHRRETAVLRQLSEATDKMISELEYRLTPLPELCLFASQQTKDALSRFFSELGRTMDEQVSPDIKECTNMALSRTSGLPGYTVTQLQALGQTLGRFDLEGQINALMQCRQACLRQLEVLEFQQPQRLRSYQTLGFCAGAALAILLF
ncbi:MAG: hypothetical protein E7455_06185 [Ruminococcaceae bacterium]|nr:hypothetical protein [Oscillospiraceae bacterium]